MPNYKDGGRGRGTRDGAEIMRNTEHRPVVRHGAEVGILRVGELPIRDELLANDGILTSLIGGAG